MANTNFQFFFTQEDPDYSLKGSRDPLAFQVLWQSQGKKLIPYLSTVSGNLNDFQILCLAYYFYGKDADNAFVRFFLRFEQLMAYVRIGVKNSGNFNGVERVKKKLIAKPNRIYISNTTEDEILSNQRAYGIWGKYNRPFQDIKFTLKDSFYNVFDAKISALSDGDSVSKIITKTINNNQVSFSVAEIECMKELLYFTKKEKVFYRDAILKVEMANPYQNQLYEFISNTGLPEELDLYPFLKSFSGSLGKDDGLLKGILKDIEITEKLLCPLNNIFRYLQTKPIWEKTELLKDKYILGCKKPLDYIFQGGSEVCKLKNHFNQSMAKDNWSLVQDLVVRNKDVTEWRGGIPLITTNKEIIEVHRTEGGSYNPDFNSLTSFENDYFLNTYLRLCSYIQN